MKVQKRYAGDGIAGTELVLMPESQDDVAFVKELFNDLRVNEAGQSPVAIVAQELIENGRKVIVLKQAFDYSELPPRPSFIPTGDGETIGETEDKLLYVKNGSLDDQKFTPKMAALLYSFKRSARQYAYLEAWPAEPPYLLNMSLPVDSSTQITLQLLIQNLLFDTLTFPNLTILSGSQFQNLICRELNLNALVNMNTTNAFAYASIKTINLPNVTNITAIPFANASIDEINLNNLVECNSVLTENTYVKKIYAPKINSMTTSFARYSAILEKFTLGTIYNVKIKGIDCPLLSTLEFAQDIGIMPIADADLFTITTLIFRDGVKAGTVITTHNWTGMTNLSQASIADLFTKLEDNTGKSVVTFRFATEIYAAIPQEIKDLATGKNYIVSN